MYYEDTDAGGVVYHANYLRYCERARGEWLRELGFAPESIRRLHGVAFAVRRAAVEYARPAVLDDLLSIESEIVKMGKTSIFFRHDFFAAASRDALARAEVLVVCVAPRPESERTAFRARPIPPEIADRIQRWINF